MTTGTVVYVCDRLCWTNRKELSLDEGCKQSPAASGGEHHFLKNVIDVSDNIKTLFAVKRTLSYFPRMGGGEMIKEVLFCMAVYIFIPR